MRKNIFRKSLVLGIIILFVGACVIPSIGINVVKRYFLDDIKTTYMNSKSSGYIQDLIDNAKDGDTIFIPSGIYYENIVINKSISLIGEGMNTTIIDGGYNGIVISIVSDWVNISGFAIQNGSHGWLPMYCGILISSNYNNISDNTIAHNEINLVLIGNKNTISSNTIIGNYGFIGISLLGCSNTISGNNITNNEWDGIRIYGSYNTIAGNIITNNGEPMNGGGISLYVYGNYGMNNIISGNNIINNEYGISLCSENNTITGNNIINNHIELSSCNNIILNNSFFNTGVIISEDTVCNNLIMNNTVNDKPHVYLYNESDLVLDNDAGQIILIHCSNITVKNQEIFNTTVGIQILGSKNCVVSGNTIANNKEGMHLFGDSNNNTISENIIANNREGILLSGVSNFNIISGNTITNNTNYYGIYLDDYSDYNNIINNTIVNNNEGIILQSNNNTISGNTITNNYGFEAVRLSGNNNTVSGNIITNNQGAGIDVVGNNNTVSGNIVTYNDYSGIIIYCSNYNNIINNTITKNSYGIYLRGQDWEINTNNTISGNIITNNINYGIYLDYYCIYNNIIYNAITNNEQGIFLDSKSNTISGNTISNNECGINLSYCSFNIIYHNNFINNTQNALSYGNNNWDDGKKGNYWDDYKEKYPKAHKIWLKGIWDTPYEIQGGNNKDNFPLIKPFNKPRNKTVNIPFQNFLEHYKILFLILQKILNRLG